MLRGLAYLFREWEYSASSPKRPPLLSCVDAFVESLWAACGLRGLQAAACSCKEIAEAVQLFMRARPALNRPQNTFLITLHPSVNPAQPEPAPYPGMQLHLVIEDSAEITRDTCWYAFRVWG